MPEGFVSSSFRGSTANCSQYDTPAQWKQNSTQISYASGTEPVDTSICSLRFDIPDDLKPPVLLYYRLTNFYQNHRRYVKSLDTAQLSGEAVPASRIRGGPCDPLEVSPDGRPYYPCGLIANSLFNDTFSNPVRLSLRNDDSFNITYNMTDKGIAWDSEAELYGPTKYNLSDIAVPPNWHLKWQNGYTTEDPPLPLHENEPFQVWMRTAGLPAFSKLAKRNDNETMRCSRYQVDITNSKTKPD